MKNELENDILKVLLTEDQIKARITEMGEVLTAEFFKKTRCFWAY